MDRKQFIQTGFRVVILGAMAALTAFFIRKDKLSLYSDCPAVSGCRSCNKFGACSLPKAVNVKNNG